MSKRYDAIVIGAGVAGSATAILLADANWRVALVEKRAFPRRKVCGECIAATNLPLLEVLGVGENFEALAGPSLERVRLYVGEHTITAALPRFADARRPWGRALGREQLDSLLLARAAACGVSVRQPWAVTRVYRAAQHHVCELIGEGHESAVLEAPVVIDAHGSWERTPSATRPRQQPRGSDLLAFKANFDEAALPGGYLPVLAFTGGYGGMVIADQGRLTLACCIQRSSLQAARARLEHGGAGSAVEALLRQSLRGVREALAAARRDGPWLAAGPIRPGIRPLWHEQSGFAVGNAAGEAHPILGEGISMALQGAWLLSRELICARARLLAGENQSPTGAAYARAWRGQFASRIRWAALFAHMAMRPDSTRVFLPILRRWPEVLTLGAHLGGKVRSVGNLRETAPTRLRVMRDPTRAPH